MQKSNGVSTKGLFVNMRNKNLVTALEEIKAQKTSQKLRDKTQKQIDKIKKKDPDDITIMEIGKDFDL